MCERIDWEDLRIGANHFLDKNYKTVTDMLKNLYAEQKTLEKVGDILGISGQTVHSEMKRLNIPRLPKGHRGHPKGLIAIQKVGDVSSMTIKEIIAATGYSRLYTYVILRQYKIPYQRKKENKE